MKKITAIILTLCMFAVTLAGCSGSTGFDKTQSIAVMTRESGSGTRGAFIELFKIEQKDADGNKVDKTTQEAETKNSTAIMMTTVAENEYAIGYISLGSLNDTVKALKIDGAEASVANIKADTYKIARPFIIATNGEANELAADFISYIMSSDGQAVIENNGYISVSTAAAYSGTKPSGTITISGSSSVTPVMEKLKEAYLAINTNAQIDVSQTDSTSGMTSTIEGVCDIGMSSRELKDSELSAGLNPTVIAMDGIAVIVNNDNPLEELTSADVLAIFTGEKTLWSDYIGE